MSVDVHESAPAARRGWMGLLRRHRLTLIGFAVGLAVGAATLAKKSQMSEWVDVYVRAARDLLSGTDIYAPGRAFLYPPFTAALAAPMAGIGDSAARLLLTIADALAVVALGGAAWRLAGGGPLNLAAPRREWALAAIGVVVTAPYVINAMNHGQTDVLIDALAIAGCYTVSRGRSGAGGALVGLAAAFKGPPILLALFFAARRDWRATLAASATALAVNLAPDLIARAPADHLWMLHWLRRYVVTNLAPTTDLGSWGSALIYNQSLAGTVQRLVNDHSTFGAGDAANAVQIAVGPLKLAVYGALAAMLAATLWVAWRSSTTQSAPEAERPAVFGLISGAMLALMLLASPMSGLAHFPALAVAALCAARLALSRHDPLARAVCVLAMVAALAVNKDLVGRNLYDLALWSGITTLSTVALWAVCLDAARRSSAPARGHVAAHDRRTPA